MEHKFSKSLIEISEQFLETSALKHQIAQTLLNHDNQTLTHTPSFQNIDNIQLQNIIMNKVNKTIDTKSLKKILFKESQVLTPQILSEYLQISSRFNTQNIMNIIRFQTFSNLLVLESQTLNSFQRLKDNFNKNSEALFKSIDVKKMEMIDSFSLVNFVKTHTNCTISSKSATYIISLIKYRKGDYLQQQEWTKCFKQQSHIGTIRSNRVRTLEKKLNKCKSYENCERLKPTITNKYIQIPDLIKTQNSFQFASSFNSKYSYTRGLGSIQYLLTSKPLIRKSRNSHKIYNDINMSQHKDYENPLPTQLSVNVTRGENKSCIKRHNVQKSSRIQITNRLKQPYQAYLEKKKTTKQKQQLFSSLSNLNQLLGKREQYISRISTYRQFNPFNAFNILDSYDLGGINYGQFSRQLENMNISVTQQNKRNFWSQATKGNKNGLSYQNFIDLFKLQTNMSYYQDLSNREPILRRFQGLKSWKKQLQYSYKQFLKQMINNIGEIKSIKFKIKSIMFGINSGFKLITDLPKLDLTQLSQILGSNSKTLFQQMVNNYNQLTEDQFNNYFSN